MNIGRDVALTVAKNYVKALVRTDLSKVDGVRRDPDKLRRLLRSYARIQGTQTPYATIGKDIFASEDTTKRYVNALKQSFVIEELPAWNPNL